MTSLTPLLIAGYKEDSGLELDKKPFLLPSAAFQSLENAYVFRERVKKRRGNKILGRLSRVLTQQVIQSRVLGVWTFNLFSSLQAEGTGAISGATNANPIVITTAVNHKLLDGAIVYIKDVGGMTQINNQSYTITRISGTKFSIPVDGTAFGAYTAGGTWEDSAYGLAYVTKVSERPELKPGSVEIHAGSITFFDNGTGQFTSNTVGNSGVINYITGDISLICTGSSGTIAYANLTYYPNLPVMGIWQREEPAINAEQTIWWNTKYAFIFTNSQFQEFIPFTYWDSNDYNFFWATNYRGSTPSARLFFETNFLLDANDPMRYTDGTTWTNFSPAVDSTNFLTQAEILIPYYGRLLALNTWEGPDINTSVNIYNRCRFSQIGSPVASDAWRSDIFGKGGFIDAPTNEAITSAQFFKNTLIVFFERSTWQLRYVGEYGIPFIWERISSDFGCESQFSPVLFDEGVLAVGNRAIITSSGVNVTRIDEKIPDKVFTFKNNQQGVERVQGARDFQQELVYWNYSDVNDQNPDQYFPNKVLVLNYRNHTWADYRDNVTCFGIFQPTDAEAVTWSNTTVFWNNEEVFWDDVDSQSLFEFVVSGNNQGYVHLYHNEVQMNDENMPVSAVSSTGGLQLTIPNHNLVNLEFIYLTGLLFVSTADPTTPVTTDLNDNIYQVQYVDADTIQLLFWDGQEYAVDFTYTPDLSAATYIGGGQAALLPIMNIQTKDFNPYQDKGLQLKTSYIDFLTDDAASSTTSITLFMNSSPAVIGNLLVGDKNIDTELNAPYYVPASDYAWHRFFATTSGQFMSVQISYGDDLINQVGTHESDYVLNAMMLYVRPGGKNVF